jgi:uncharacterized protein GlcG (DUF336 family)
MNTKGLLCAGSALFVAVAFTVSPALAQEPGGPGCDAIAAAVGTTVHTALSNALNGALGGGIGLGNDMWGTIVDRDGTVCAVAKTGAAGEQWPGSRVISAQKANTANAFSLPHNAGGILGLALSTANLYSAVQPGGSLFGLQESNPVNPAVAYVGSAATWGTATDPLVGQKIGGVNVFGGGLTLYTAGNALVGGVGVSGDTSCMDHIVAWRTRHALNLDNVIAGVANGTDNIIFDIKGSHGNFQSKGGFGHPECGFGEQPVAEALPTTHPVGPAAAAP